MRFLILIHFAAAFSSAGLALLLLTRGLDRIANWAFLCGCIVLATERFCSGLSAGAATFGGIEYWQHWRLLAASFLPAIWLVFGLTYARGNAMAALARWRPATIVAFLLPVLVVVGWEKTLFYPVSVNETIFLRSGWSGLGLSIGLLIGSVLIMLNLERTFRSAVGTMRWRIKLVLLGTGVLFLIRIYTSSQALLFRGFDLSFESINSAGTILAVALLGWGVLRAKNSHTEVYPSLEVLHGSITIAFVGLYLLVVGVLAKIVTGLGWDASFSLQTFIVLISLVALALLLQSDRARLHLRQFLSRNFQRSIYDYRSIWQQFTERTTACVESAQLCDALVRTTADIFQSLAVSIWLMDDRQSAFSLAASTSISPEKARALAPSSAEAQEVLAHFRSHAEAVDFETKETAWAEALRRWHPIDFPNGGNRVCVPLLRQGEPIGILIMGDRVKGISFPLQDFDLLKCIADQSSAKLLNIQLAGRLVQAKELEAFQTMATFLIHDLKNATSTLNLMLKNMPVHFNDPAFREDALRGMGKTVLHMNGLIGRLGQLRGRLELHKADVDLNDIVQVTLADFPTTSEIPVSCNLVPLPSLMIDREQVQKVVLNLLLNATEACQGRGAVRITTSQQNGSVVLSVVDNGCGMSAEFMQSGLFRPFQTTKKSGLGIGMFQSKMIVEAHGGNIAVTSASGKGTTFEIFLPLGGSSIGNAKPSQKTAGSHV